MDHFDTKVNKMRLDIDEINKEIEQIQKVKIIIFNFHNNFRKIKLKKELYQIL